MATATIHGTKKYLKWLIKHLQKEHRKTKGMVKFHK
jgi:hypothetical protein